MKISTYHSYDELPLFLNAELVAKVLGVSISSAYELMHEEVFPSVRIGSRFVVPKDKFRQWVERQTGGAIEDRRTYQCHPSYATIGKAVGMSRNTVRKYVQELEERGLIRTERTSIITRDGRKQNGSLLYTILPIQFSIDQFYQRQMDAVDRAKERQRVARRMEQTSV